MMNWLKLSGIVMRVKSRELQRVWIKFWTSRTVFCQSPECPSQSYCGTWNDGQLAYGGLSFLLILNIHWHGKPYKNLDMFLNYLSTNERLPTQFLPVSPPPYMNGEAKDFLAWVIQCNHAEFSPDVVCDWLEARLPNPVDNDSNMRRNNLTSHHINDFDIFDKQIGFFIASGRAKTRFNSSRLNFWWLLHQKMMPSWIPLI